MSIGAAALVLGPPATALVALLAGGRDPRRVGRFGVLVAAAGFVGSAALAVWVAGGQVVTAAAGPLALRVDRLAVVLLLLVFGVSATVQAYAVRYLAGDRRSAWFTAGAGLITGASAGLMTAATLIGLAAFWTMAGLGLCLLLGMYWELPAARDGVRRAGVSLLIGDLALWAAVAIATAAWGPVDLAGGTSPSGPLLTVVALLVVLAALSRSAQFPFHRWLPATLAAPTPVSALLHAGVVNAGGILLIRLAPLTADDVARVITVLAGAVTMAYGAVVMLVKPDVKGALVHSTTAQMGFMILTCGLGLWAAAVLHLVAHGFYKATLFLSSGSAIAHHRRARVLPPAGNPARGQRVLRVLAAIVLPAAALLAASAVLPPAGGDHAAEQALLVFAWVTGGAVTWGWLRRNPGIGGFLAGAACLAAFATAYVAVINLVGGFLDPALPPPGVAPEMVWLAVVAALVTLAVLSAARWAPIGARLQHALYTNALSAGYLTGARS